MNDHRVLESTVRFGHTFRDRLEFDSGVLKHMAAQCIGAREGDISTRIQLGGPTSHAIAWCD